MQKTATRVLLSFAALGFIALAALPLEHSLWRLGKDEQINKSNFYVLLFPKIDCPASTTCVDRAVTTSLPELDKQEVQVVEGDGVKLIDRASFAYIPNQSLLTKQLSKWRGALFNQGYSDGQWVGACSQYPCEVELVLSDGKHGRKEIYQYLVTTPDVVLPQRYMEVTWIDYALKLVLLEVAALLCLMAALLVGRSTKRN